MGSTGDSPVVAADSATHPVQVRAWRGTEAPHRIESFNDRLLAGLQLGRHEEMWIRGALGERVQVWLFHPPGFDARKKYPLLQVIHGGPHTSVGRGRERRKREWAALPGRAG